MLLSSYEFSESLFQAMSSAEERVVIASAFVKVDALTKLLTNVRSTSVEIVARWQKRDLVAGASDLDVYNLCKEKGWRFGISLKLHGKLYCIDRESIYLGSANLTSMGLGLVANSNLEFGTKIPASETDLLKVDAFFEEEIFWIDDEIFMQMTREVELAISSRQSLQEAKWSDNIIRRIDRDVKYLWADELPFCPPTEILKLNLNNESSAHDYDLFGLDIDTLNDLTLKISFRNSRVYSWVLSVLKNGSSLHFGGLTFELHNSLLNDPKPYRKDVKQLVAILFSWFEYLDDEFEVSERSHNDKGSRNVRLRVRNDR